MQGFIKDYRQELGSDIWMMPPLYHRVWQYLKYTVNHKDNYIPMRDGSKMLIKRGQRIYSKRGIAQGVGWYEGRKWKEPNPKTINTILVWLEKQGMIKIETKRGNNGYTLITLSNWDSYQSKEVEGNNEGILEGTFEKQKTDKNKNDKECFKNEKEDLVSSSRSANAFDFYQQNFGVLSPYVAEDIQFWIDDLNEELVIKSMQISLERKKHWDYAKGILKRWIDKGIKTIEDVEALKREYEARQQQNQKQNHQTKEMTWEEATKRPDHLFENKRQFTKEELEELEKFSEEELPY